MAFCGVETGSMNPNEAPKTAAIAGTSGFTPAAVATGRTMGTTIEAAAVLLLVSDIAMALAVAKIVIGTRLATPSASPVDRPICSPRPVLRINPPNTIPAPQGRMVPQSNPAAALQL